MQTSLFLLAFGGAVLGGLVAKLYHALHPKGLRSQRDQQGRTTTRDAHRLLLRLEDMTGHLAEAKRLRGSSLESRLRPESLSKLGELLAFSDPEEFLRGRVAPWRIYEKSFNETLQPLTRMTSGHPDLDTALLNFTEKMTVAAILNAIVVAGA
jgi:hypothetical protein